jgi:hypothetical protein
VSSTFLIGGTDEEIVVTLRHPTEKAYRACKIEHITFRRVGKSHKERSKRGCLKRLTLEVYYLDDT